MTESSIMVNGPLPRTLARSLMRTAIAIGPSDRTTIALHESRGMRHRTTFAQILGKSYFFELSENLRTISLDYGQKLSDPANAAFNAAC
jgi:hypothetical protein